MVGGTGTPFYYLYSQHMQWHPRWVEFLFSIQFMEVVTTYINTWGTFDSVKNIYFFLALGSTY